MTEKIEDEDFDYRCDAAPGTTALHEEYGWLVAEARRARAEEAAKDRLIRTLTEALKAAKVAMHRGEFGDRGRDRDVPAQVDAALLAAAATSAKG